MNYTTHYNLPQWELSDRIMMEDFNQMCADIDAGISDLADKAYTPDNMPYAAGTYTGDGKTMAAGGMLVELGFSPSFVIITRGWNNPNAMPQHFYAAGPSMMEYAGEYIQVEENGFRVGHSTSQFQLNTSGLVYSYIAFR